jgi:DNA-binding transcriptional LysR family regulator
MNYTLHQLAIFLKVAEKQSITKAAEALHLTQPAVSIQLKKLQQQFELPLVEVVGRQLHVTDFGEEMAIRCRRILKEAEEIKYTVDQYKGLLSGKIKVSVVSTGKYVIPFFLKSFMDLHPGVDISIDVSNKNKVIDSLLKNESDFYLVSVVPEGLNVEQLELMDNRLFLVGSTEYRDLIRQPKDLEKITLLFREQGSATRNAMTEYLDAHEVEVGKSMELVSNEAVKQAIFAGIGCSIIPVIGMRMAFQNENIQVFPLEGLPITTQWRLIYAKSKNLTPAQRELVRHIQTRLSQTIEDHFAWAVRPLSGNGNH